MVIFHSYVKLPEGKHLGKNYWGSKILEHFGLRTWCGNNKNAKDGGVTMMEALNYAKLDYVSLGNHELLATAGWGGRGRNMGYTYLYLLVAVKSCKISRTVPISHRHVRLPE